MIVQYNVEPENEVNIGKDLGGKRSTGTEPQSCV